MGVFSEYTIGCRELTWYHASWPHKLPKPGGWRAGQNPGDGEHYLRSYSHLPEKCRDDSVRGVH